MSYENTMNRIVQQNLLKAGANVTDVVAIQRMFAAGDSSLEISRKLLIKEEVVKSFMPPVAETAPGTEYVEDVVVEKPRTFKEVVHGKRK